MIEHEQTQQTVAQLATEIADHLKETEPGPRIAMSKVVALLGRAICLDLLQKTQEIEAKGGMMTSNGKRRRTPGGVWFYLARGAMTPEQRRAVWPKMPKAKKKKPTQVASDAREQPEKPKKHKEKPSAPTPVLTLDERIAAIAEAETEKGTANVKITLVGRPGKVVDRGQCIVTVMEDSKTTPSLPKGLPTPTSTPTKYAVYIASKQWAKVKDAIADPEDVLIIEGVPKTDAQVSAIAVFTTSITTKKLQAAQRQTQKAT